MAENELYVTKIRTLHGDKQIDYDALANLPEEKYSTKEKTKLAGIAAGANKTIIVNSLESDSETSALSAHQGKILDKKIVEAINSLGGMAAKDEITLDDLSESVQESIALANTALQENPTPEEIGAAKEEHGHDASEIVSGNIALARLGAVTPDAIKAASLDSDNMVNGKQACATVKTITTNSYTILSSDIGKFIISDESLEAFDVLIPDDLDNVNFGIGAEVEVMCGHAGKTTISSGSSTILSITGDTGSAGKSRTIYEQYGVATIKKIANNKWVLKGDVE